MHMSDTFNKQFRSAIYSKQIPPSPNKQHPDCIRNSRIVQKEISVLSFLFVDHIIASQTVVRGLFVFVL